MIDQSQLENVNYFKQFGSIIANDAKRTLGIKSRFAIQQEEYSFNQQIGAPIHAKIPPNYANADHRQNNNKKTTSAKTAHPVGTLLCYNIA